MQATYQPVDILCVATPRIETRPVQMSMLGFQLSILKLAPAVVASSLIDRSVIILGEPSYQ